MANKEETLGNSFIEAIATIAQDAVSKAGYDKTIKAQVVSAAQADKGQYSCKYGATTFTAIGTENTYAVDDIVMISIPENNWDNPKVILNKIRTEEIDFKSLDPFDDFLDVHDGKPLITGLEEVGVKANILSCTERSFGDSINYYDFQKIYDEPYTRLGLEIAMKTGTLGSVYNVNSGTYGIRLKFFKDNIIYFETSATHRENDFPYYTREEKDGEYVYTLYEGYYTLIDKNTWETPTRWWYQNDSDMYILIDDVYTIVPKDSIEYWDPEVDYYYWTTDLQEGVTYYQTYFDYTTPFIEYEFNSSQMFGNLYNFGDYYTQKLLIKIKPEDMALVKDIQVTVFQGNDFTCYDTQTGNTQRLYYPGISDKEVKENIFAKDLKLQFGYGKEEYKDGDVVLTLSDPAQYYNKWEDEKNTKHFSWVYWYKDSAGVLRRSTPTSAERLQVKAYFEYCVNNKDWVSTRINSEYPYEPLPNSYGGGSIAYFIDADLVGYESIQFRVRMEKENFNSDSSTRYSEIYSNTVTLYKYEPTISSAEQDSDYAIQFKYEYRDKIISSNANNEENVYTKLNYNKMENQLYSQYEFLTPHCIHINWLPTTLSFQKSDYLAGATITWKVPAFEYTESVLAKSKYAQASERFNFETTTLFMRPRPGYEYGAENNTVRFETIEDVTYMVWDIQLSREFVYDVNQRNKKYYYGENNQSNWSTMQALTLTFRPKEYYLPSMVNNTIYCVIKKDNMTFNASFEVPLEDVDLSETANKTFIFTEDFEKPYLINERLHAYDPNQYYTSDPTAIKEKIFHFCTYRKEYDDSLNQSLPLNFLRPVGGTGTQFVNFNENLDSFQGFINNPNTYLGSYWVTPGLAQDKQNLDLPAHPVGVKYNFIIREEDPNSEIKDKRNYLYYFDIVNPNNSDLSKQYIKASEIINGSPNWSFDEYETYFMKVRDFGYWPYGETVIYLEGTRVIYEGKVYKCNDVHAPKYVWDPSYWDEVNDDIILPNSGEDYHWIIIGSPNQQEYEAKVRRFQEYYLKPNFELDLTENTKVVFKLYGIYFMYSESSNYVSKYTIPLGTDKQAYIQNNILPILRSCLVDSRQESYLKEGYWYYDQNNRYVPSPYTSTEKIQWYTLRCPAIDCDNFKFLMLQTKVKGIATIKEIPIYYHDVAWDWDHYPDWYIKYDVLVVLNGMNKIYCDGSGMVDEKNMGPSEMPYHVVEISHLPNPVDAADCFKLRNHNGFDNIVMVSYETTQKDILPPSIKLKDASETYYKALPVGYTIESNLGRPYYIYYNGEYLRGDVCVPAEGEPQIEWYKYGEIIREIELPYVITPEDFIYIQYTSSNQAKYLRYDNVGFTTNYKEVGEGDEFPAETVYSYENRENVYDKIYMPIVFQQRQLFRDDFNQWSGDNVEIGEDAIYSPVIGAGRKKDGKFSGCLMGDVSTVDLTTSNKTNYYGLYGYHNNVQSFGLRADGTMFIGKEGNGQILLDGNNSTLQSSLYKSSKEQRGMKIDLDDAIVKMVNNYSLKTQEDINQAKADKKAEITEYKTNNLLPLIPDLYKESGIWEYEAVPSSDEYNKEIAYFYVENPTMEDKTIYYYTQDEEFEIGSNKYYVNIGTEENPIYEPVSITAVNNTAFFETQDHNTPVQTKIYFVYESDKYELSKDVVADMEKTYYKLEEGVYVVATVDETTNPKLEGLYEKVFEARYVGQKCPLPAFETGVTYYERRYYYEKMSYKNSDNQITKEMYDAENIYRVIDQVVYTTPTSWWSDTQTYGADIQKKDATSGEYILIPKNTIDSWESGKTYYYLAAQLDWNEKRQEGIQFFTRSVGKTPTGNFALTQDVEPIAGKIYYEKKNDDYLIVNDPVTPQQKGYYERNYTNGPNYGYNIRFLEGEPPYSGGHPEDPNKYYLYLIKNNYVNDLDTYFFNEWYHYQTGIYYDTFDNTPLRIGTDLNLLESTINVRASFDDYRFIYNNKDSEALAAYNSYANRTSRLENSLDDYQEAFKIYYERDTVLAAATDEYQIARNKYTIALEAYGLATIDHDQAQTDWTAAQEAWDRAQQQYLPGTPEYEQAKEDYDAAEEDWKQAESDYTTAVLEYNHELTVWEDAEDTQENEKEKVEKADENYQEATRNFNISIPLIPYLFNNYINELEKVKPYFLQYQAYQAENINVFDKVSEYSNNYSEYINLVLDLKNIENMTPDGDGTVYGIKLDASAKNLSDDQGDLDLSKYPLMIGELKENDSDVTPFKVNWMGEMTATKGTIGGWVIGKDTLSAKKGNNKFNLSSKDDAYPIQIGSKFKVMWDGTIIAKKIQLGKGILEGDEDDNGAVLKQIKNLTFDDKGKGLSIGKDGFLHLNNGIVLDGGGSIKAGNTTLSFSSGGLYINGDTTIQGKLTVVNSSSNSLNVGYMNISNLTAETLNSKKVQWRTITVKNSKNKDVTINYLGY